MASNPPPLRHLATFTPSCSSRTWLSTPHPSLPLLATASSDKTVRIYSLTSFTLLSTITGGHKRSIRTCAWKPNTRGESVLATGSFDASAGIWRRYDPGSIEEQTITDMTDYGQNGSGDGEGDDDEWRFSVILDGHESEIKSVSWSSGGQFLATCSRDKSVWIWEELEDDNFETIAVMQEHEGDVKTVSWHPSEDLLASGSYDDTVRLYREDVDDWACVCVIEGHDATVWCVEWEGQDTPGFKAEQEEGAQGQLGPRQTEWLAERIRSGPRLLSSSDDISIRVWRRVPKEGAQGWTGAKGGMPSILKTNSIEEEWVEDARLPQRHERSVYSVAWSKRTGLVVSTGSDGKIVVYRERWKAAKASTNDNGAADHDAMDTNGSNGTNSAQTMKAGSKASPTEWGVIAEVENAHDVFEVNHVCWARRQDKGRRSEDEEVIISTGDDGEVKVWVLDDGPT